MWLARQVVNELVKKELKIAFAESCTGGMLAGSLTAVPGSSRVFDIGLVTYANSAKSNLLGVLPETLNNYGAVSEQTAKEMVQGLQRLSRADIAISVTGIAGPGGGSEEKPVGLVYIGYIYKNKIRTEKHIFYGTRKKIRTAVVKQVLQKTLLMLEE